MTQLIRPSGRAFDQLREITLETNVTRYAEGSCLAKFGNTHVLCTASWEKNVPGWMKGKGAGWVTAEYGMTRSRNRLRPFPLASIRISRFWMSTIPKTARARPT